MGEEAHTIRYGIKKMPTKKCSICGKVRKIRYSHLVCKDCGDILGERPTMYICDACSCLLSSLHDFFHDTDERLKARSKKVEQGINLYR